MIDELGLSDSLSHCACLGDGEGQVWLVPIGPNCGDVHDIEILVQLNSDEDNLETT
jgi:hypothetical protein